MDLEDMYAKTKKQLDQQLPFVIYRKAGSSDLYGILQKNDELYKIEDYATSGFIFAPFDDTKKAVLIPAKHSVLYSADISEKSQSYIEETFKKPEVDFEKLKDKEKHVLLINEGIQAITSGVFKKVVLSRREEVKINESTHPLQIFKRLVKSYPKAFVYCWYHPKIGTWLGATPETLLHSKDDQFFTMALAGTQPYDGNTNVIWGDKELEEQEMVKEFIVRELSPIADDIVSSKTYTYRAGTLLHLRTDIKANMGVKGLKIKDVIQILHPTPAVCGLPKNEARSFIFQHEGYDRKFYTGFFGELNMDTTGKTASALFVNLRCMELEKDRAVLYVGGGITKDSDPGKEWEETVRKTATMKKVLF